MDTKTFSAKSAQLRFLAEAMQLTVQSQQAARENNHAAGLILRTICEGEVPPGYTFVSLNLDDSTITVALAEVEALPTNG